MERGIDVMLKASYGVSSREAARTTIKSLPLYLKGVAELSHTPSKAVAGLLVRPEMLNFTGQCGVVLVKDGPIHTPSQFQIWVQEQLVSG